MIQRRLRYSIIAVIMIEASTVVGKLSVEFTKSHREFRKVIYTYWKDISNVTKKSDFKEKR